MHGLTGTQDKILEALLFASGESVELARLAEASGRGEDDVRAALCRMAETYAAEGSGVQLIETDGSFQLCTNPEYDIYVRRLLNKPNRKPLTQTLLETLSIIAYKQPVTKAVIEEIRGVNADHAVNRLLELGLVVEKGRLDAPGKPLLFGTSAEFLRYYGLRNLDELFSLTNTGENSD